MNNAFSLRHAALVASLALAFLLPDAARAQTDLDALRFGDRHAAVGARGIGFGGVGIAGIADPSALFLNPAGLAYFRTSQASGALGTLNVRDEASYGIGSQANPFDASLNATRLENLSYVAKAPTVQGSLVFGIGFHQTNTYDRLLAFEAETNQSSISTSFLPLDYDVNQDERPVFFDDAALIAFNGGLIEFLPEELPEGNYPFYEAVVPGTTIRQRGEVTEGGTMSELVFGGAVETAPGVMAGLSLNLGFGRYRFESRFEEDDINDENTVDDYIVLLENRELYGFDYSTVTQNIRSNLFGISARGGISFNAGAPLRIGLTLESPTYYNINEDYNTFVETGFDEGGAISYGDQAGDVGYGTFEYQLTTPWRFGLGAAYVQDGLTLAADAEYVDWSQLRFGSAGNENVFSETNRNMRDALRGTFNTRVGAEYTFNPVSIRAGFGYQPDPYRSDVFEDDAPSRARTSLSAGLSYRVAQNTFLDFGWTQTSFEDSYAPYRIPSNFSADAAQPLVTEQVFRNRFALGVRIGF